MNEDTLCRRATSALWMTLGILAGLYLTSALARATPPDFGGADHAMQPPPPPGGPDGPGHPQHPLLQVFDTNRDGELTANEVAAASAVLAAFDTNGDGSLQEEELVRGLPPPERGGQHMAHDGGRRGPPPPDGRPRS